MQAILRTQTDKATENNVVISEPKTEILTENVIPKKESKDNGKLIAQADEIADVKGTSQTVSKIRCGERI